MSKKRRDRRPNLSHLTPATGDAARIRELEAALRPFAHIEFSPHERGADIWFYQGVHERHQQLPHLQVQDLIRARAAMELA